MEAILGLVVEKIGSAVAEKAVNGACSFLWSNESLLEGIDGSMDRIKREFEQIKASSGKIDTRRNNNENMDAWLKDVREIAYDMEDVIDEYTYLITEEYQYKFIGISCSAMKKATNFRAWHQIATRLRQIEEDTKHVFETMRQRYGTEISEHGEGSSSTSNHFTMQPYDVEDDQIIGMVEEKETLIGWMSRENFSIITVWGMGGSGKTALVNSAFKNREIQRHFDITGWVPVSQSFQRVDLLRSIYKSLENNREGPELEEMDFNSLVERTRDFLHDKRFLIILDDVWDPNAYFMLENIFRDPKLGSKIVITTRIKEVASLAKQQCRMEHRALHPDEAWDLFCNKAFWQDAHRRCPQEVEEWGRKIVDKCDGLPLAIVAIARVLSLKKLSDWKHIYDRLSWEFTSNSDLDSVKHILNLSYYDLPGYLKNCFLYCSIFPEDHAIRREELIKLWVAEGFVQSRGAQTVEDVAADYMNELVHRCMLHGVEWNILGKVKTCRMHDLVRDITVRIARDENFSTVVTDPRHSPTPSSSVVLNEARRLSIHGTDIPKEIGDLSGLRSLIVFDHVASLMSVLSSMVRYQRVLVLKSANITELPHAVGDLFNLHYLDLRWTKIKRLPNSIGRLHNLQTLDLRYTRITSLPRSNTKLKNLKRLYISNRYDSMHSNPPKGLWNLTRLQRLEIWVDEELVRGLRNLTLLRKLTIEGVKGSYWPHLLSSLSEMKFLSKLNMFMLSYDDRIDLVQPKELGNVLRNLVRLNLTCRLLDAKLSLLVDSLGDGIRDLRLACSRLRDDPLPQLSRLSNLIRLVLCDAYDGERLCFGIGWFPNLKILTLAKLPSLSEIIFEEGSLGSLKELRLVELSNLKQVPQGNEFQQSIIELQTYKCSRLLGEMMRGEQSRRITHIPSVRISEEIDGRMVHEVIN